MGRYVIKRLLMMVVILWCAGIVIFTMTYLTPGDVPRLLLGAQASSETVEAKRAALGLDKSYLSQLGTFMVNTFVKFDFGTSWATNTYIVSDLAERIPRTLILGLSAMVLNVVLGTLMGIYAAINEGKWQDSLVMIIAMLFVSMPDFFIGLLLMLLFALKLGVLPAYGIDSWTGYILPILATACGGMAVNARQARSSMLEVIRADFVTTARSKGQKEGVIIRKHMLPNAMMPIITGVGGGLAVVVAGSPVIETVFSIPGLGAYMLNAINTHDYPAIRASVVFFALFASCAVLLMDLCYAFLDPRIKAQYSKGKKVKDK
ncbi:MAG: ABC transporter permease [Clostridiales bacterium]|nr:ABC transporter permease [Clostridiales bacterium]